MHVVRRAANQQPLTVLLLIITSPSSLSLLSSTILAGSTGTRTPSLIEKRLMLDLLAAESALEEYRNLKADEVALTRGLEHNREALRATLLSTTKLNSLMNESDGVILDRPKSVSALLNTETGNLSSL